MKRKIDQTFLSPLPSAKCSVNVGEYFRDGDLAVSLSRWEVPGFLLLDGVNLKWSWIKQICGSEIPVKTWEREMSSPLPPFVLPGMHLRREGIPGRHPVLCHVIKEFP